MESDKFKHQVILLLLIIALKQFEPTFVNEICVFAALVVLAMIAALGLIGKILKR